MRKQRKKHHHHPVSAAKAGPAPTAAAPGPYEIADLSLELPEPVTQRGSIPIWLIALVVLLFYWADMYVVSHGADLGGEGGAFPGTVYDPYVSHREVLAANPVDPARQGIVKGKAVFSMIGCVACHQANGLGIPGQFPPLAGSEWVIAENPSRIIRIVINGLTGPVPVKGETFNNSMPPLGPSLSDEQIANVLTYVRNEWGNKAPPVKPEQVAKVRAEVGGRGDMFTAPELQQVPDTAQ